MEYLGLLRTRTPLPSRKQRSVSASIPKVHCESTIFRNILKKKKKTGRTFFSVKLCFYHFPDPRASVTVAAGEWCKRESIFN